LTLAGGLTAELVRANFIVELGAVAEALVLFIWRILSYAVFPSPHS
jgi:hypothetical protein